MINKEDIRNHLKFLNHTQPTEIIVFDSIKYPKGKVVFEKDIDKIIKIVEKYNIEEKVSVYFGARDRIAPGNKNIISSEFILFEIDEHDIKKPLEKQKVIDFCKKNKIELGLISHSGGGNHFYIPIPKFEINTEEKRSLMSDTLNVFKKILLDNKIDVDPKVFDLQRVMRVMGSFNHKRDKLSKIEYINFDIDREENQKSLSKLFKEQGQPVKKQKENNNSKENTIEISNEYDKIVVEELSKSWNEGKRQEIAMSLSGYLKKKGFEKERVVKIIKNICEYVEDNEAIQRINSVHATYNKKTGEKIQGYKGLSELIPDKVIKKIEKEELNHYKNLIWIDENINSKNIARRNVSLLKKNEDDEYQNLFYIANNDNEIIGKVQPVSDVKKTIPLITKCKKTKRARNKDDNDEVNYSFKLLGDKIDLRNDGFLVDQLGVDFYIYKLKDSSRDKEYYVLSEKKLNPVEYKLKGGIINLNGNFEIAKDFKLGNINTIFLVKEYEPSIKTLDKKDLIDFVKNKNISYKEFREFMNWNPDQQKIFHQEEMYDKLKNIHLLSGKYEGYPLSLFEWATYGTGKTIAAECKMNRFEEPLFEAGNSTPKGLVPSFKESVPKLGYLIERIRYGIVDEFGKLIENMRKDLKAHEMQGAFSPFNMILTHKKRAIGSGTYSCETQATGKFSFMSNPLAGKQYLDEHVKYIDSSTLSRGLNFCLDEEIIKFIRINKPIPKLNDDFKINNNDFLTIYDSCQKILSGFDEEKVKKLFKMSVNLSSPGMKQIWNARGLHHSVLVLDGIVKLRCLFNGDTKFIAEEEDYNELEYHLIRIVKSWEVDLQEDYLDFEYEKPESEIILKQLRDNPNSIIDIKTQSNQKTLMELKQRGIIQEHEGKGFQFIQ